MSYVGKSPVEENRNTMTYIYLFTKDFPLEYMQIDCDLVYGQENVVARNMARTEQRMTEFRPFENG